MMPQRKWWGGAQEVFRDIGSIIKVGGGGGGERMHGLRGNLRVSLESDLEHFVWEILLK